MGKRFFLILYFTLFYFFLSAQPGFEKQLSKFLNETDYQHASVGVCISDIKTGKNLFSLNEDKLHIPASVMKVITSAAALEILGADYRFKTIIGYSGDIENGVLKGDLIVAGSGDPALGSEYFQNHYFRPHFLETWARQIKSAGIERIEGNLIMDGSVYDSEDIPGSWTWADMGNYYGAGADALTVYDNSFRITFRSQPEPGLPTEIISINPVIQGLEFKNEVLSSDINSDQAYVYGSPIDGKRKIKGTIPKNRKAFTIRASNPFPAKLLADDFINYMAREGVFLSGKIFLENASFEKFTQLIQYESPPLHEIIKVLNHESVNMFTEHMVKQIALKTTGKGNSAEGLKQIAELWKEKGLDTRQLIMSDGSGLSHFNAVTPSFVCAVLNTISKSLSNSSFFKNSLPQPGAGTIGFRNIQDEQKKNNLVLNIKSGSMMRVRCYAGYINSRSGKNLSFSIMVNHFAGSNQKLVSELEKLILEIYNNY